MREVQRRLHRLGYRPGPIDGLFGPLTAPSVAWFQVKHGHAVNGRATLATVGHLRARTGASDPAPAEQGAIAWTVVAGHGRRHEVDHPERGNGNGASQIRWYAGAALLLLLLLLVTAQRSYSGVSAVPRGLSRRNPARRRWPTC